MKIIRSATRIAKPSSWVTTIIVIPASASALITEITSGHQLWVQSGCRFVKQHQPRLHGECPGDGDALEFPSG